MKRLLVLVVTAVLAAGLYAATAGGGGQSVTPAQIAALNKKVAQLQKDVKALREDFSCLHALGAKEFGDGQTAGYHYRQPDGSEILTSALDLTGQGEAPMIVLAQVDPSCVASFRGSR
jgi:outer membrane murein-binding lipoprotein Lpp